MGILPIVFTPEFAIFWFVVALAVAFWGHSRGNNFFVTLIGAVLLSPVLMALAVAVTPVQSKVLEARAIENGESKKCPFCAEIIKSQATKCRFCGEQIPIENLPHTQVAEPSRQYQRRPGPWNDF